MEGLDKLLTRLKKSLDQDVEEREIVAKIIKEVVKFDIRLEDISIKGDTLRIKTSPVKKNEIKLYDSAILAKVGGETKLKLKRIAYWTW